MAKKYQAGIRAIFNEESEKCLSFVKQESYRGVSGDLAASWRRETRTHSFKIYSEDPKARWKIAGRGPGKMPPIREIAPWALSKGISPWRLALAIAKRGTQRWRTGKNFINMDRAGKIRKPNVFEDTRLTIMRRVSRLKFGKK